MSSYLITNIPFNFVTLSDRRKLNFPNFQRNDQETKQIGFTVFELNISLCITGVKVKGNGAPVLNYLSTMP
jgi:hypothetical protein